MLSVTRSGPAWQKRLGVWQLVSWPGLATPSDDSSRRQLLCFGRRGKRTGRNVPPSAGAAAYSGRESVLWPGSLSSALMWSLVLVAANPKTPGPPQHRAPGLMTPPPPLHLSLGSFISLGITPDPSFSGSAALRRPRSRLRAHLVPPPRVHRVSRARQGAPSPHESRPPRPGSRRSLPVQVAACSRPHARLRGTRGHPPGNASAPPKRAAGALQPHKIIQDGALRKKTSSTSAQRSYLEQNQGDVATARATRG